MATINLICPKCKKILHTEDESRYYDDSYGCTIMCYQCALSLIGVDLSVCAKCREEKKTGNRCNQKFTAMVEYL